MRKINEITEHDVFKGAMKNRYTEILKKGKFGPLLRIIDPALIEIKRCTETEKIRIFSQFIFENLTKEITAEGLIREFCLLEKSLGSELNGRHLLWADTKKRYQSFCSQGHYQVIIAHALGKLGILYEPNLIINKKLLGKISKIIWH